MSLDSKLDLDDVAAGHPVAMMELAALREELAGWRGRGTR